jgi:hypothetical protein
MTKIIAGIVATIISGFTLAIMIAECRQIRQTHDAVIRLEEKQR